MMMKNIEDNEEKDRDYLEEGKDGEETKGNGCTVEDDRRTRMLGWNR